MKQQHTPRGTPAPVENSDSSSSYKWWIMAVGGVLALGTAGYLAYGYYNNYNQQQQNKLCFHGQVPWQSGQDEKEKYARAWMEQYIKGVLLNQGKNKIDLERSLELSLLRKNHLSIQQETRPKIKRKDSMIRTGTGKYQDEQLGNCIATEKGLLKREDYEHIQKVIEVYSKALLCQVRESHQNKRLRCFKKKDWQGYADLILK